MQLGMLIKISKNEIIELCMTGKPDDVLWHRNWRVHLGRRFFVNRKWSFYFLIWNRI